MARKAVKRLGWTAGAGALLALLAVLAWNFYQPSWLVRAVQGLVPHTVFYVETEEPVVALTFDDGPDPEVTPRVLDILGEHGVPSTWFLLGSRVVEQPELYGWLRASGHQVANHMWEDRPAWRLSGQELLSSVRRTEALLRQWRDPRLFRPGGGLLRPWYLDDVWEWGYCVVLASAHVTEVAPERYRAWALERMARPGAILILHVGPDREGTIRLLPELIEGIRKKGLEFVTLEEMVQRGGTPCHPNRGNVEARHRPPIRR